MDLLTYLNEGKSPYQVVDCVKRRLLEAGFCELSFEEDFKLTAGGRYFVIPYATVLFAFTVAEHATDGRMHIACAHTDFPCLKLKSHPELSGKGEVTTLRANVEPYGGLLKRTWFDRPLGVAGKVLLKGETPYSPKEVLFDSETAWMTVPSLAPHLDKEAEKRELDVQKEMLPVFCVWNQEKPCETNMLLEAVASRLNVLTEDMLDYDLYLYNAEPGAYIGLDSTLVSSARIDNLASVAALTEGLISRTGLPGEHVADVSLIALFDNEEIGSRSKQGADSTLLGWITEKILESGLFADVSYKNAMAKSMMLSVDGAHAYHPNYPEKSDLTNQVMLGGGLVLKSSATQRYVTDSRASAIVGALCKEAGIPYQKQVNRSGLAGGQTLGPIASSYLPVLAADLGIPMLAMHSARELAHSRDYEALLKLMQIWL